MKKTVCAAVVESCGAGTSTCVRPLGHEGACDDATGLPNETHAAWRERVERMKRSDWGSPKALRIAQLEAENARLRAELAVLRAVPKPSDGLADRVRRGMGR